MASPAEHFEFFRTFAQPHFNICATVDLSVFRPFVKQRSQSFTVALHYVLTRAANEVPEFRYRIKGDAVVEHDLVHPSPGSSFPFTVLGNTGMFGFCKVEYTEYFTALQPERSS